MSARQCSAVLRRWKRQEFFLPDSYSRRDGAGGRCYELGNMCDNVLDRLPAIGETIVCQLAFYIQIQMESRRTTCLSWGITVVCSVYTITQ